MRRIFAFVLSFMIAVVPALQAGRADGALQQGTISGTAERTIGGAFERHAIQLRNLETKLVASTTTTDDDGAFTFTGVGLGTYGIELLNEDGKIICATVEISPSNQSPIALTSSVPNIPDVRLTCGEPPAGFWLFSLPGILLLAGAATGVTVAVLTASGSQ